MSIKNANLERVGRKSTYHGQAAFVTTGVTVSVAIPLSRISAIVATPIGSPNANEPISVDVTVNGDGEVAQALGTSTVTFRRAAGTTSGLKFFFIAYGEAK